MGWPGSLTTTTFSNTYTVHYDLTKPEDRLRLYYDTTTTKQRQEAIQLKRAPRRKRTPEAALTKEGE